MENRPHQTGEVQTDNGAAAELPPATGTPETTAGDGTETARLLPPATSSRPSADCSLTIGTYNCEGFLSAFQYVEDQVLPLCDILVLTESWLSRAEETYIDRILAAAGHTSFQVFQTFAMETPPGGGRAGGAAAWLSSVDGGRG